MIDENKILEAFREDRLEPFYSRMYSGLLGYASRLLGDAYDFLAEDCVQNAILQAWKRKKAFHSAPAFKSFLYVTIRNEVINIIRKNSAREKYISELEDDVFFCDTIIEQEVHQLLYQAVNNLPEKHRVIFEMSFIEGLKNIEIAKHLDISESSVQKRKASALEILREKLDPAIYTLLFGL